MASAITHFIVGAAVGLPAMEAVSLGRVLPRWAIPVTAGLFAVAPDLDTYAILPIVHCHEDRAKQVKGLRCAESFPKTLGAGDRLATPMPAPSTRTGLPAPMSPMDMRSVALTFRWRRSVYFTCGAGFKRRQTGRLPDS